MTNIVGYVDTQFRPSLSFVVPVKDEEATLETLFRGIAAQATKLTSYWEVIFVDDGSSDGSWKVIRQLAVENEEHVKAIRFRRNVGKAEALAAGWKECRGDFVFTMDADLQDDPEEIPRFLEKMREGFDVVTGWKRTRHDPWHKVLPSRIFNFILSHVNKVELHDHNCGFKCYRAEVVQCLPMYGEMHRMVPSLAAMHGFRTAEIPVRHHPRLHGRSKYGLQRFLRGFLDMWTVNFLQNFRQRPMHLMGTVSLAMLLGACCLALFLARVPLRLSVFLLLSSALPALLIGAVLTIMIGLLAEWNVHQSVEDAHFRPIAETIGLAGRSRVFPFSVNKQKARAEPSPGATALLLDDDPATRELNAAHLREAGWQVLTAASCWEARSKLKSRVEMVVLNANPQDSMDARLEEFLQFVTRVSPPPEIVFLPSRQADVSFAFESMRQEALDYLSKRPAELVELALRSLNGGHRASTASEVQG
ncbi:MAG: glycosyltransferase [Verrucomicrobia bacterium]|nr:glycosyltransferase [Verrucomicrobiota bacterium]